MREAIKKLNISVGTIQIQKRQQLLTKTRELKDDLYQCQQEQGDKVGVGVSLAGSHWIVILLICMCTLHESEINLSQKCITCVLLLLSVKVYWFLFIQS